MSRCYPANDVLRHIFISWDFIWRTHIWKPWPKELSTRVLSLISCVVAKEKPYFLDLKQYKTINWNIGGHYQRRGAPSTFYRNVYISMFWLIQNNTKELWIWQNQHNVMTSILHFQALFHASNISNVSCNKHSRILYILWHSYGHRLTHA